MLEGNRRFVAGEPRHPRQDAERRHELAHAQRPTAALFGCSDSRLAAEIIFDEGLGDLFVIRNAGQVVSDSVIGSLEYAVAVLNVPLIVVLGHDECGAVRAAIDSTGADAPALPANIWRQVAPIVPAVRRVLKGNQGASSATVDAEEVGREHLRDTVAGILRASELISEAVADGRVAIVGANYRLADGTAIADVVVGDAS
ncbi:carbonic anhydrase [Microbacterium sp. EYE_5]|nr:carbonic anhydrase [Microbacterium sp. EYE_382]MCK6086361.1 carbonic anhydrase [Microbacterium sp. EYE_384]MCK6124141.1 carbonic anhydrase [Microbacterium sp. EYE_80]MCK6127050.1 carbonic anhydrase [Microbacterium sp. EYE_79]MCK6142046.1 carbonic anhydrase [Microbacterium sp. EYE_39]MCK6218696.1 carbonic anhydrase [Microbacterium sp. EYE_5]MCK6228546.1 carbonic anhydrase [Microbacterium sp. EYE_77]MCK6247556.1 carbonic anhydrase [Microbacterium sp. EYE_78]